MFQKNVGTIDRALRILVGLALLAGFFLNAEASYRWLYLIGIVPLATGLMSSCPLYSIFGIRTCKG
ncbi:YgaP family membrane protein [Rhodovulum sp. YNF3179]|uniref:YgaP family membrane protein n=1 Tax=Rhodovulum sp. YNF3179 TaxID=3425127 RepID=UPI003D3271A5